MDSAQVEALAEAAADGIEFDGFAAEAEGDGYVLATEAGSKRVVHGDALDDAAAEYAPYVTNWYFWHAEAPQAEDRWAYLRWLERADDERVPDRYDALEAGTTREWGQLRVTVTVDEAGTRRYELRHVDDADAAPADLTDHDDPLDARQLAKHDDRDRYRPLKTAPTLQTGWRFADLGPGELVRAVESFYPATVANWHREREGELDISHWRETIGRQSGIYGVVRTWDRGEGHEHVDWVAEACCVDSQCVKRREWQYDEETDLDVDGGDGEFPCREPCSVVIAAARRWTKLEGEQSRTYEFELTPSEKEQIEDIVDAVADGRTEEIREADVYEGANRYRARFLRAKRFDDDGNLSGVSTDPEEAEGGADADGSSADEDEAAEEASDD
ncbi:DR2241 family protein [Halosimplex salinum]|uniref:DR2241 family protein n=1 Tax=Halosimplex salinum TaxID=1710538 RepID=UPI0013DE48EC|nr:DR2241 family protein [Halosimplex salinum]